MRATLESSYWTGFEIRNEPNYYWISPISQFIGSLDNESSSSGGTSLTIADYLLPTLQIITIITYTSILSYLESHIRICIPVCPICFIYTYSNIFVLQYSLAEWTLISNGEISMHSCSKKSTLCLLSLRTSLLEDLSFNTGWYLYSTWNYSPSVPETNSRSFPSYQGLLYYTKCYHN